MLTLLLFLAQSAPDKSPPPPFDVTGSIRIVRSLPMPESCEWMRSIAALPDLDGDGTPDVVVGGGFTGYPPQTNGFVSAFSTRTGKQLWIARGEEDTDGGEALGLCVLAIDDMDGDGIPDVAAGAPRFHGYEGRFHFLSGKTGARITILRGSTAVAVDSLFGFGARGCVIGDVDHDGASDLLLGDEFGAKSGIFSGKSLKKIRAFDGFGFNEPAAIVGPTGDVDGDGTADVVLGTVSGASGDLRLEPKVCSGATGKLVLRLARRNELGRVSYACTGHDFDGDGLRDALFAAQARPDQPVDEDVWAPSDRASHPDRRVLVLSTKTGKPIVDFDADVVPGAWLDEVLSIADVDGDKVPEIVVQSFTGAESPRVRIAVHSGKDGKPIARLDRTSPTAFKSALVEFPDTDGNGRSELAIGTFSTSGPERGALHFVEIAPKK